MSSDNSLQEPTLTTVTLGHGPLHGSLISHEVYRTLDTAIQSGKKIILIYNRRGSGRAWICEDCSYFPVCPRCDIALAYHTSPRRQLVCHHCSYREEIPVHCPKCDGTRFHPVGIGLQKVASDLEMLFPGAHVLRIDSDMSKDEGDLGRQILDTDIILATHASISLIEEDSIHMGVFLLFESDLTLPDYRMEEELYHTLSYAKKSGKPIIIQTYIPDHPLLHLVTEGNYKDFLIKMSEERKNYDYPPYTELAQIRVHDPSQERVADIVRKLVNKLELLKSDDVFLAYDIDLWEKYRDEWVQKIILKGKSLQILAEIEGEIVRNRAVSLEWK